MSQCHLLLLYIYLIRFDIALLASADDLKCRYVANLNAIANMCRSEPTDVSWANFNSTEFTVPDYGITRVNITTNSASYEEATSVIAYILPYGKSWFSFKDAKQKHSAAKNALVIKNTTTLDRDIRNKTLDKLRNKNSHVWIGA